MSTRFQRLAGLGPVGGLGLVLVLAFSTARADEDEIPVDRAPRTVLDAIAREYPDARIQRIEEEQEHGRAIYDVDLIRDGRDIDLMVTPEGTILKVERELAASDLPRAVTDAIRDRQLGTVRWAEETTRGDRRRYEVIVASVGDRLREVELDAQGTILDLDFED